MSINIDPKSRVLYALVAQVRAALRSVRLAKTDAEAAEARASVQKAKEAALAFIGKMLRSEAKSLKPNEVQSLTEYIMGSILQATLPRTTIRTDAFVGPYPAEHASLSRDTTVPGSAMQRANIIIERAQGIDSSEHF